jgi:4-amino-4-deoxy-L-arabinose transferase-like glycosyltransferase
VARLAWPTRANAGAVLVAVVVLGAALAAPLGVYLGVVLLSDDVLYARLGADLAAGTPSFGINSHHYRLGFLVPLGLLYAGFGVGDATTMLFPLLCTVATIAVAAFAAGRLYGRAAGLLAALLCGLNPIVYRFGTMALVDVQAALMYGLFVIGWLVALFDPASQRRAWAAASGAAAAWGVALRETLLPTVLLTLVGFALLAGRESRVGRLPVVAFGLGGALVALPYVAFLWGHTGDPVYFLRAAEGSYYFPGAAWLERREGVRFWARVSGLSLVRASVEGFLFAVLPVIVAVATRERTTETSDHRGIQDHLVLAVAAPLLVLGYFPPTLSAWVPIHLDLRYGSATVIPAAIVVAGACVQARSSQLSRMTRASIAVLIVLATGLLGIGLIRGNAWTSWGAAVTMLVALAVLVVRQPRWLLPALIVALLAAQWLSYRHSEYRGAQAHNAALRFEAESIPWCPRLPILTDPLTAQFLPYVHEFAPLPPVAFWKADGEMDRPWYWAERRTQPFATDYLLVWYPVRADAQARRWGGEVPAWVRRELAHGRIVQRLSVDDGEPGAGRAAMPARPWSPEAGVYFVAGDRR